MMSARLNLSKAIVAFMTKILSVTINLQEETGLEYSQAALDESLTSLWIVTANRPPTAVE